MADTTPSGYIDFSSYDQSQPSDQALAGPSTAPASATATTSQQVTTAAGTLHPHPSSPVSHDEDGEQSGVKRRKSSIGEPEGTPRVQLACFYCRTKRIRCSGTKPICVACQKASAVCEWPSGRRKKRTRREMEEARKLEAKKPDGRLSEESYSADHSQLQQKAIPPNTIPQVHPQGNAMSSQNQTIYPGATGMSLLPNPPSRGSSLVQHDHQQEQQRQLLRMQMQPQHHNGVSTNLANLNVNPLDPNAQPPGQVQPQPQAPTIDPTASGLGTFNSVSNNGAEFWDFATSSNYVWPSGFTPEDQQPFSFTPNLEPPEPTIGQFMSSPNTDMRLLNVLESGAAFIEGNPAEDKDLELFYYRFSGQTAIHPGINRIALKLQRRSDKHAPAPQPEPEGEEPIREPTPADLFDQSGLPFPHVYQPLFELFFRNSSQHFPSVSRQRMQERLESGTMSAFLACCICATGARYQGGTASSPSQAAAPFIAQAQTLIVPLLHLPTTDVVTGLLMLAWANFGQGSESAWWQYSGMAFRMAIDLGLHENSELYESAAHVVRTRSLFWMLFVTDRIMAFAMGRPTSIPEDIIEIPLPEDQDFFPDPARNLAGMASEPIEPVPFVQFVKLMIICGRISNVLNGRRGRARTLVNTMEPLAEQLAELQVRLVQFVGNLPESLKWTADNFKHQNARGHGGTFLALHLWANAVLALIYHPDLLKSPSGIETPLNASMNRSIKLSLASSRQICECMVFADLIASSSYTSTPYLVQPLFVAGMALIHEMRSAQMSASEAAASNTVGSNPTDVFLLSMARQNFSAILNAVIKMEQCWAGVSSVSNLLEKRSGFGRPFARGLKKTFISLPDKGLLKRFKADPSHPQNVHPATETSLRDSMARSGGNTNYAGGPSPYWLADLMAGYTVENMSFAPADSLDLERLLGTAGVQALQTQSGQIATQGQRSGMGGMTGMRM